MNTKLLNNWAGLISILWMVGGFALIAGVLSPHDIHFEPSWLYGVVLFLVWLGVGLLFAIAGLRRGNLAGRICAVIAVVVFVFFVWQMVVPAFSRAHQRGERPNNSRACVKTPRQPDAPKKRRLHFRYDAFLFSVKVIRTAFSFFKMTESEFSHRLSRC
jgi:hypothetical protein